MPHSNNSQKATIIYFPHGGGPLPVLGDAGHRAMVEFLQDLPSRIEKPEAILVISAHWEEETPTLLGSPAPPMLYDYYGFPEQAYKIEYPAPGQPQLAERIATLLQQHGLPCRIDAQRGFDHGLFIPLMLMVPEADIPALQLSLLRGLDAGAHIALGRALQDLARENILVLGSGFSFHNMRAFSWGGEGEPDPDNDKFQNWLIEVCTGDMPQSEREELLIHWENAPASRYCHPREEHLLPLHVCAGMAGKAAELVFDDYVVGKRSVAFLWR